jgi:ABC-2 type transport system permease protein
VTAARAIARRAFADGRTRTISFALLFGFVALVQVVGYEHTYPTLRDRIEFARSFGGNAAVRLFYGIPHDLLTVGGYASWRVGGILALFAAVWGMLAAVRAMRAEEDAGRQELVLAGAVTRSTALAAALAAIGAGLALLWLATFAGLAAGGLAAGESAYLALAVASPGAVFVGVGALVCQLAPTRRLAVEAGTGIVGLAFLLRVVADTSSSLEWLRWASPLGWAEEMRPFVSPQPAVLLLPLLGTVALLAVSVRIALRRDVGSGLMQAKDRAAPRLRLLGSPLAQALRGERGSLLTWLIGTGLFAIIVGLLAKTFTTASISPALRRRLEQLGASVVSPSGALGFYFLFFVLLISLFACAQVAAMRREEAEQRLETLFALPVGRRAWLGGRLALAVGGCAALALAAGFLAWAGAASQGVDISLPQMIGAGANCLPAAVLFLGFGMLAFALAPRAAAGISYGLVSVAFVWELFGALLGAPRWLLGVSPFHQVALVPAQSFKATAAAAMVAVAAAAVLLALRVFERRDVIGD